MDSESLVPGFYPRDKTTHVAFYLGIDGGGTKTSCLVGDERSVLGSGTGAGSNLVRVSEAQASDSLAAAVRQACSAAKVAPKQITRTCVGMAGAARPQTSEVVTRILRGLVTGRIDVVGDMSIAFEAAFGLGPGVIVIAGTGSIAYGRNSAGKTARAGGWGPAISDEGSGHWIGRSALAAAMRVHNEGNVLPLLQKIMQAWGLHTHDELVLAANASPAPNFSVLSPLVSAAAEAGETLAMAVLSQAGSELAALAEVVIHRLFGAAAATPVAMAGGVFGNSAQVRRSFYNSLCSRYPGITVNPAVIEPVRGALEMARRMATLPG